MVTPIGQYAYDHVIDYTLELDQTRDYILLQPDHNSVNSFENDNWDYDFFYSISAEPESMRWRVVGTEGEGVLVTVRNHRCPRQATWAKSVWCDAAYFDRPWMCDIEIPTRAAHPGDNAYFVSGDDVKIVMHLLDLEEMKVLISVLDLFHIIHGDGIIILLLIMKLLVSLNNYMNISEYNHVTLE